MTAHPSPQNNPCRPPPAASYLKGVHRHLRFPKQTSWNRADANRHLLIIRQALYQGLGNALLYAG